MNGMLLPQLVEVQAAARRHAPAIVHRGEVTTYGELDARANVIAHVLRHHGVARESRVAVCLPRSAEVITAWFGVMKAGGAYLPLDPEYPAERLAFMLRDADATVLITTEALANVLPVPAKVPVLMMESAFAQAGAVEHAEAVDASVTPAHVAYVIYTSGSTGQPKGVLVPHEGLRNLVSWHMGAFGNAPDDRGTFFAGLGFDAAVFEVWPMLAAGASIHIASDNVRATPESLRDWLLAERITVALLPTVLAEKVLAVRWPARPALRFLLTGGDKVHAHPPAGIPFTFVNNYGPTEYSVNSTSYVVPPMTPALEGCAPSIGTPILGTRAHVLDDDLKPLPPGEIGEIYLAGAGLARGYHGRPALTAERFVPDPFATVPGARMYRTGDRARLRTDGAIDFIGRVDNQVKIRGYRIEIGEIEAALHRLSSVREAVVCVREDEPGQKRLVAYVVPSEENLEGTRVWRRGLKEILPVYMIPSAFVRLAELPLDAHGKVNRRALPEPPRRSAPATPNDEWESPVEATLARLWREVLQLPRIGRTDDFFDLGGDSILAMQIVAKARRQGLMLTQAAIFHHTTIAALASNATDAGAIPVASDDASGDVPLTMIQRWFFEQELPAPHHFNQSFLLETDRTIDPVRIEQALDKLIEHHDALRLRYEKTDGGWRQNDGDPIVPVEVIDLSETPRADRSAAMDAIVAQRQASLSLEDGPTIVATLFRSTPDEPTYLSLVVHHLLVDGVSWRILGEDLDAAYDALEADREVVLPPKTASFRRWAHRVTEHARTASALRSELELWTAMAPAQAEPLPVDLPGGANLGRSLRMVWVTLDAATTRALLQDVPKAYGTQVNDVLLTALARAFAEWTGKRSLLVNVEAHGREELFPDVDLSRTVGWFTSFFPLLLDLRGADRLGDALLRVKEQLRKIPQRGISYGLLRYLSEDADVQAKLAALPQPEVNFNYLGQFDASFGSRFGLVRESHPSDRGPENARPFLLEIDGHVVEGCLRFSWAYSDTSHHPATIERVASAFVEQLRAVVKHCASTSSRIPVASGVNARDRAKLSNLFR